MKKQKRKVIINLILCILILISIVVGKTYAESQGLSLSILTDKSVYEVGQDIEVRIKLNENVVTASYYLNYDSSLVTYKEAKTSNLTVKDYPSDNLVRAVYADMSGSGANEMILVFTVKDITTDLLFNLTNTSMVVADGNKTYSQNDIIGINNGVHVSVNNSVSGSDSGSSLNSGTSSTGSSSKLTDSTVKTTILPKTGIDNIIKYLMVLFLVITIYLGYNVVKLGRCFKF